MKRLQKLLDLVLAKGFAIGAANFPPARERHFDCHSTLDRRRGPDSSDFLFTWLQEPSDDLTPDILHGSADPVPPSHVSIQMEALSPLTSCLSPGDHFNGRMDPVTCTAVERRSMESDASATNLAGALLNVLRNKGAPGVEAQECGAGFR